MKGLRLADLLSLFMSEKFLIKSPAHSRLTKHKAQNVSTWSTTV